MQMVADQYDFCVSWMPFLLRPHMPKDGLVKPMELGGAARVFPQIKAAGEEVGVEFTGRTTIYPNTIQAHILLEFVEKDHKLQNDMSETLFKAYFTDGSVLDETTLVQVAKDYRLDTEEVLKAIRDKDKQENILKKDMSYKQNGVTGVPFFYMNGQKTFSGAQEPEIFVKMFDIIANKFPLKKHTPKAGSSSNL